MNRKNSLNTPLSRLLLAFLLAGSFLLASVSANDKKLLIAYYTNWAQYRSCKNGQYKFLPESISPIVNKLDVINYAFAKFDTSGNVLAIEWNDCQSSRYGCQYQGGANNAMFNRVVALKQQNPNLKVLISVGGWSWSGNMVCPTFSAMARTAANRQRFASQLVAFCHEFGFDGVDVDWEYPGATDLGCSADDPQLWNAMMHDLHDAFQADNPSHPLMLTAALPAGIERINAMGRNNILDVAPLLDHINIMTYDYYGSWNAFTGHNTPMNAPGLSSDIPNFSVKDTMQAYVNLGISKDKLTVGMATYGRSYMADSCAVGARASGGGTAQMCTQTSGVVAYYEVLDLLSGNGMTKYFDNTAQARYACNSQSSSHLWLSYDDTESLADKSNYVNKEGFAGAMVWALDMDDFANGYPLMNAIHAQLNNGQSTSSSSSSSSTRSTSSTSSTTSTSTSTSSSTTSSSSSSTTSTACPTIRVTVTQTVTVTAGTPTTTSTSTSNNPDPTSTPQPGSCDPQSFVASCSPDDRQQFYNCAPRQNGYQIIAQSCAPGTVCIPTSDGFYCGFPS